MEHDHKGEQRFRQAGADVFGILNASVVDARLRHFCSGASCICGGDPKVARKVLLKGMLIFIFGAAPGSPEVGKWTLLGPAVDKVFVGMLTAEVYKLAFAQAFDKMRFKLLTQQKEDLDAGLLQDICWTEVSGQVAQDALGFLQDDSLAMVDLSILALALEPVRMVMRLLFALSREGPEQHNDSPGVCVLSDKEPLTDTAITL